MENMYLNIHVDNFFDKNAFVQTTWIDWAEFRI